MNMKMKSLFLVIVGILLMISNPLYAETNMFTGLPAVEIPSTIMKPVTKVQIGGNVLWDTYHGIAFGYSPSDQFSSLKSLLESKGYTIDENNSGILNLNLGSYDIIVTCLGSAYYSAYFPAEVTAIENFVNSGGGLLIMGDNIDTPNGNINPISQIFGTTLGVPPFIISWDTPITNLTSHTLFAGISEIYMEAAGTIVGIPPSSEEAWADSGEAVVTVAEPVFGRVVSLGDINIMDNIYITSSDNQLFSENVFDWLVNTIAGSLIISPPSGTYVTTQGFDLTLIVETPSLTTTVTNVTWNGTDVTTDFNGCAIEGTLTAGGTTFRCPNLSGSFLGNGTHNVSAIVDLSDGSQVTDSVTWEVKGNTEP